MSFNRTSVILALCMILSINGKETTTTAPPTTETGEATTADFLATCTAAPLTTETTTTAPPTTGPGPPTTASAETTTTGPPATGPPTTAPPATGPPITASPTTATAFPTTTAPPTTASETIITGPPTTASPTTVTAFPTTTALSTTETTTTAPPTTGPPTTGPLITASPTTATAFPTTTAPPTTASETTTTASPTTGPPIIASPTTAAAFPTTTAPSTTGPPTTAPPTTGPPTTAPPTTASPTTASPTTGPPTRISTGPPTTGSPTTAPPTTASPTTSPPTTASPTTGPPTTGSPTTAPPTTGSPTTAAPTTASPTTGSPTTASPTTGPPTTGSPTTAPPTTASPTTGPPTTASPTTGPPTTGPPTTAPPTTASPTTGPPTTALPTTAPPTTASPTTGPPTTTSPTAGPPTTAPPTTALPTTAPLTTGHETSTTEASTANSSRPNVSDVFTTDNPTTNFFDSRTNQGSVVRRVFVIVVIAGLAVALIVVCILLIVFWRKRNKNQLNTLNGSVTHSSGSNEHEMALYKKSLTTPLLEQQQSHTDHAARDSTETYDYVVDSQYSMITASQMYSSPKKADECATPFKALPKQTPAKPVADSPEYQWNMVVPSLEQRTQALKLKAQTFEKSEEECLYAAIRTNTFSPSGRPLSSFFEESDRYWLPPSDARELYKQLSLKRYREIPRHFIKMEDFLGSGAYGTVSKGVWQHSAGTTEVAVKTLLNEEKVEFLQEAAIMGQFRHMNVVRLIGVVTIGEPVMIVLELLSKGDLQNNLLKMRPGLGEMVSSNTPKLFLKFCQQICNGMEYLARKAFVHRDLAARNILVSEELVCKIGDFGMSRNLVDENYYVSHGGKIPVKWTAPEAIFYKKYSSASDVWSFGCVMYEIWSLGHKPFETFSNNTTVRKVEDGVRLPPPPGCPREVYRVMIECWHSESSKRPSFAQLVEVLSQADFELHFWREEDTQTGPQVSVMGAPLQAAHNLFTDLQHKYLKSTDDVHDWYETLSEI